MSDNLIEGRIVHYVMTSADAAAVNAMRHESMDDKSNPNGFQVHNGNFAITGEHVPAIVVRVWKHEFGKDRHGVNLQCFMDGNDSLWKTSIEFDEDNKLPGTVHWIERE